MLGGTGLIIIKFGGFGALSNNAIKVTQCRHQHTDLHRLNTQTDRQTQIHTDTDTDRHT